MIKIVLADDHHLVRQGIRSLLERQDDVEILGEAEDGYQALDLVRTLHPDLLITDIGMPRLNGIQTTQQVRQQELSTQVVILSMYSDRNYVQQAIKAGARGYLLKNSVKDELLLAVRAVSQGGLYLSPSISEVVTTDFLLGQSVTESVELVDQLTSQEREVLKLVAEGYTNKDVADTMHVSVKTVEKYRASMMSKLDVKNLAELIRFAIKHGVILLDE